MVPIAQARQNRLFALLADSELQHFLADLEFRPIPVRTILQPQGRAAEHATFPLSGVASMICLNEGGEFIEVATIGYEGMIGLSLYLGGESDAMEVIMQVPGEVLSMKAEIFRRNSGEPAFRRVLNLYTQALITQIAQASSCNRVHAIEQRCARWLLQTHDRARSDRFELTHEFLGFMLGVRRATVSEVAEKLQRMELIRYQRGVIDVTDRSGLERVSCPCYALIAGAYDRLLGVVGHTSVPARHCSVSDQDLKMTEELKGGGGMATPPKGTLLQ